MSSYNTLKRKLVAIHAIKDISKSMECIALYRTHQIMPHLLHSRYCVQYMQGFYHNSLPLKRMVKVESIDFLVMANHKGLCCSMRNALFHHLANNLLKKSFTSTKGSIRLWISGRNFFHKYEKQIRDLGIEIQYVRWLDQNEIPEKILHLMDLWISGLSKSIYVIYAKYINVTQHVISQKLLMNHVNNEDKFSQTEVLKDHEYSLKELYKMLYSIEIRHAYIESLASEFSAKGVLMKSAQNNANELLENYVIKMNAARQSTITQEINELMIGRDVS